MSKGPIEVALTDVHALTGKFMVLFRKEVKTAAKIIIVDLESRRIGYELLSGPDKGKRFSSCCEVTQSALVYEDAAALMGLFGELQ